MPFDITFDGNDALSADFEGSSEMSTQFKDAIIIHGSGAVDSVNGKTGAVVLDADDVGAVPAGQGIPSGGTTGQVLKKTSGTGYDVEWANESGGGGGTSDYADLTNKPSIEGVTLSGNKTASDLGLAKASDIPSVPSPYTSSPAALGTASPGSSANYAKGDHVHPMPSAADVGAASEEDVLAAYPTPTVSGSIASFADGSDGLAVKELTVDIDYNAEGVTGMQLTHTGKNIFGGTAMRDGVLAALAAATDDQTNRYVSFASSAAVSKAIASGFFKPDTRYTFILRVYKTAGTGTNLRVEYTNGTGSNISGATAGGTATCVYVSTSGKNISQFVKANSSGTTRLYYDESGIFEGVLTADDFAPYSGEDYTVDWTAVAGTIYGGSLNLTTGVLTSTLASDGTELAEPVTYQIDPVEITTLLGVNNIWADTGDVSVTYRADPTLYGGSGTSAVTSVNGQTGIVVLDADDVGAVASDQGTANAGKFLVVGSDGVVAPVTMATWQGGSY